MALPSRSTERPRREISLARQGVSVALDYGFRSVEMLGEVAEVVEGSVLVPGSLLRTATGICFTLRNPPLRLGAFREVRLVLNGQKVPADHLRIRPSTTEPFRGSETITRENPVNLLPGRRIEVNADVTGLNPGQKLRVRLELVSLAIPPLVWMEFADVPHAAPLGV